MKPLAAVVVAALLLLSLGVVRARRQHQREDAPARAAQGSGQGGGACDLGAGPCTRAVGDAELTLELSPTPVRTMRELAVRARLVRGGAPVDGAEVRVSFDMVSMNMGKNEAVLQAAGEGRYQGGAVLVRCSSGERDWIATAVVRRDGAEQRAEFPLQVAE